MSRIFDTHVKLPVHLVQIFLALAVLILSVVRMLNRPANAPRGQSNTMALGMSAKSLIVILYQLLCEHVRSFKPWSSPRACVILNALEVVLWGAVVYMMIQSNLKFCQGLACTLSWVVVGMAVTMSVLSVYMTIVTWYDLKHFEDYGTHRAHSSGKPLEAQSSESVRMESIRDQGRHRHQQSQEALYVPRPTQPGYGNHPTYVYYESDGYHHGSGRYWN
ncbi:hypothetical protein ACJZ2D_006326 [Fusarium nematophilum]